MFPCWLGVRDQDVSRYDFDLLFRDRSVQHICDERRSYGRDMSFYEAIVILASL